MGQKGSHQALTPYDQPKNRHRISLFVTEDFLPSRISVPDVPTILTIGWILPLSGRPRTKYSPLANFPELRAAAKIFFLYPNKNMVQLNRPLSSLFPL